jgi:hypothetical protein
MCAHLRNRYILNRYTNTLSPDVESNYKSGEIYMTKFEQLTQDTIDQHVVHDALADIERYTREAGEAAWAEKYYDAGAYIDSLYDEFTPDISEQARMVGKIAGASALALAEVRYGRDDQSPKVYGGSYEERVLATYHHGGHPRAFIRNEFRYAQAVNAIEPGTYAEQHYARFPIIGGFHDLIMGNGRGHDERQSARFATEFMMETGMSLAPDAEAEAGVLSTTWDAARNMQAVEPGGQYEKEQRAAAVADLLSIFDESGPYQGVCCVVEDMCKRAHDQIFVTEADAQGFSLVDTTIDECMRFIDSNPRLTAQFGKQLAGQAGFFANFQPADPRLDELFAGRAANVQFMEEVNQHYAAGNLSALDVLHACRDYMNK